MIVMRKFILTLAATMAVTAIFAQNDMVTATSKASLAKEFLEEGNYLSAVTGFKEALSIAEGCGEEGLALASTCKDIIPKALTAAARKALQDNDFDSAVSFLADVVSFSGNYGDSEAAVNAKSLIQKVLVKKAGSLINSGEYDEAVSVCESILQEDPNNGIASLRLGMAQEALGNYWSAVDAYKAAFDNGQEKNAAASLGRCYLTRSIEEFKSNNFTAAVKDAVESGKYVANPQALQIAGSASVRSGDREGAIKYFEEYLGAAPNAENASQVAYSIGALYQESGNSDKAIEYFSKALSDPKYGQDAKKALDALRGNSRKRR